MQQAGDNGEEQGRTLWPAGAWWNGQLQGVIHAGRIQEAAHTVDVNGVIVHVFERQRGEYEGKQRHA
jgi:hypothetical protein